MTREEAIAELNTFKVGAKSELGENALDMAIKALEQEPVLDKVRTEIEELEEGITSYDTWIFKNEVLDIIDKYKVESEKT
jgi:hypothetical protein